DDAAAQLVGGHAVQGALHLKGNPLVGDAGLPLLQALAHADDGVHAGIQHGVDLLVDGGIGLAEILPPLAVAHDDVLHAQVLQHVGGDLAGVGALLLKVHVLGAHGDPQVLERLGGGLNVAGRDTDQGVAPLGPGHDLLQFLGEFLRLSGGHVHFPVSGDNRFAISAIHGDLFSFMSSSIRNR
ncbi:Spore coat protein gerQ, partial [Dysosmobacter welbionis]